MSFANRCIVSVVIVFLSLFIGCKQKDASVSHEIKDTVIIGTIGRNVLDEIETYQPFVNYLNAENSLQKYHFKTVAFVSLGEMKESLMKGETDFYIDSPFPIIKIKDETGLELYLNRLKGGVSKYHSVIFVRKDSDIDSVKDLVGKTIAFEDKASTSSYFLPRAGLMIDGYRFQHVDDNQLPDSGMIGYVFSNDDDNTALWVYMKKSSAGATNNNAFASFPPKYHENFKIIYETKSVPRHLIACRSGLSELLKNDLKKVLLNMHVEEKGRDSLNLFEKTLRIEEIGDPEKIIQEVTDYLDIIEKVGG